MKQFFLLAIFVFASIQLIAQDDAAYIAENYSKEVYNIEMRDGIKLHTIVYRPKDETKKYPMLMKRTCYSIKPYGEEMSKRLGPSTFLMKEGYIFVYQDVRGRYMSEGTFENMRPHLQGNSPKKKQDIDESSDTYDTVDWLIKNIKNNNGKVGQWGISYPGFYTAAAIPEAHPALVASSPQAPISDFFFDDFHHMGAFLQSYLVAFPVFGYQKTSLTEKSWYDHKWKNLRALPNQSDGYKFNLALGPLKNITENIFPDNELLDACVDHPNYDEYWQSRNILPHLKKVKHAVMTVGGWFDAEDLYGPLNIYKNLEKNNPKMKNTIVMGPWSHGDWARLKEHQVINHIHFGDNISEFYQKEIELPFFNFHLKKKGKLKLPEAYLFDTGKMEWTKHDVWPPKQKNTTLTFAENGKLLINQEGNPSTEFTYLSDPNKPVPYTSEVEGLRFTPRPFMTDDQRHASRRPDVLTFETDDLTENLTLSGEIIADLQVLLSTTDADFVVKVIDVYPEDAKRSEQTPEHIKMGGYQMLVRSEVFRGRFRNSFSKPAPFVAGKEERVMFPLQDILHTFKKGHRVMIQIHSTWFPYIDRNPQTYVPSIYEAKESDFVKSLITLKGNSSITIGNSPEANAKFEKMKE